MFLDPSHCSEDICPLNFLIPSFHVAGWLAENMSMIYVINKDAMVHVRYWAGVKCPPKHMLTGKQQVLKPQETHTHLGFIPLMSCQLKRNESYVKMNEASAHFTLKLHGITSSSDDVWRDGLIPTIYYLKQLF